MDYSILLPLVVVAVVLLAQICLLGRKMSEPEKMLIPMPEGLGPRQQETISRHAAWLASMKLEYRTSFQFGNIQAAVFQQGDLPRFFSFLFHQSTVFAAESYLADLTVLDTGSSGNQGLFPRPGAYAQSFPKASAEEVWQRHLEGEAHLAKKFGFQWAPIPRSYEDLMMAAVRLRMQHNRAQPFWPVRVLYRYCVTRHRSSNRTIAQQLP